MGRVPEGWTPEQAEEWHQLHRELQPFEGLPAANAETGALAVGFISYVEETFAVADPLEPPLRLQLSASPRHNTIDVEVRPRVSITDFYVDESLAVILTHAAREKALFVQRHWPGTPLVVRYRPRVSDERWA